MPRRKGDWYFDTVTLSNFALARRLDLLVARYGRRVQVTGEVFEELLDGVIGGHALLADVEAAVRGGHFSLAVPLGPSGIVFYKVLLRTLAPGEASCVAQAKARGGRVVTDDRAARSRCVEQGVPFTGTIGILKASCLDGTLKAEEADAVLQAMIRAGYHSPVRCISGLV